MPRFDEKHIKEYGKRIAKALRVVIKCDEFGKQWNKDNKDCQLCKIDSSEYHSKCRQFTKGEGAGYRPRATTYRKKKKSKKVKRIIYKPKKRMLQPFKRHSRSDVIYRFIKDQEAASTVMIMKHLSDYFECDSPDYDSICDYICYMRKQLDKIGHEKIVNYRGWYTIKRTVKGDLYGNTNEARALRAERLKKEREEENKEG